MAKEGFIERKGYEDGGDISSPENMTVRQAFDNYTSIKLSEKSSWGAKSEFDKVLKHLSKFIDVDKMTLAEFNTEKTMDIIFNSDTMLSGKVMAGSLFTPEEVAEGLPYSKTIRKEMALKIRPIINQLLQGQENAFKVWNGKNSKIKNTKFKDKTKYPNAPDSIGFATRDGDARTYVLPSPDKFQQAIYKTEQRIASELKNNANLADVKPSLVKAHMFLSAVTGMRKADIERLQKIDIDEVLGSFDNETKTLYIGNKGNSRAYSLDPILWSILSDAREQATHEGHLLFPQKLSTKIENFYLKLMTDVFNEENIPFPRYDLPTAERHAKREKTSIEEQRKPRKITHQILRKFTFSLLESLLGTAAGDEIIQHTSIGTQFYRALQAGNFQTLPEVKAQKYWWKNYADVNDIKDYRQYLKNNNIVINLNNIAKQVTTGVQELAKDAAESIQDSDTWSKLHTLGYTPRNITWLMNSRGDNAVDYGKLLFIKQGDNPSIDAANKAASTELEKHIQEQNRQTSSILDQRKNEYEEVQKKQEKSPVKKTKRQLLVQNMALKITELADDPESIDFNLAMKFADQFKNEDELIAFLDKKDESFRQTGKFSFSVDNAFIQDLMEGNVKDTPNPRMSAKQYKNVIRSLSAIVATGASLLPAAKGLKAAGIKYGDEAAFQVFDPTTLGSGNLPLSERPTVGEFVNQDIDTELFQQDIRNLSPRDEEEYLAELQNIVSQRPLTERETDVDEKRLLEGLQNKYPQFDEKRIDKGEINRWRNIAETDPTYQEDEHRYTELDYSSLEDERIRSIEDIKVAKSEREYKDYQDQMSAIMGE